jgi:hypothetical protein
LGECPSLGLQGLLLTVVEQAQVDEPGDHDDLLSSLGFVNDAIAIRQ